MTVAEEADRRKAEAVKVIEVMEGSGCVFSVNDNGWTITGPKCAYGKYDRALTDLANEITLSLRERCAYIERLVVHAQPARMQ